jgi:hypothetical protein
MLETVAAARGKQAHAQLEFDADLVRLKERLRGRGNHRHFLRRDFGNQGGPLSAKLGGFGWLMRFAAVGPASKKTHNRAALLSSARRSHYGVGSGLGRDR